MVKLNLLNSSLKKSIYIICILLSSIASYGQSFLEVPVRLDVDKGDLNDVVVKVQKDGKDAFTQSGASKMRFKLDYNRKYTLIFTKPGYVTKTIEINTSAPAERIAQKFDPYKIGVKIYKQGDEANKVVYNQPVARIKYDKNIDEFNFDTDYSKSILSALDNDDDKKDSSTAKKPDPKTPEPSKTSEPSAQAGSPVATNQGKNTTSNITASTSNEPTITPQKATPKQIDKPDSVIIDPDEDKDTPPQVAAQEEKESPAPAKPISESEHSAKKNGLANEEHNKLNSPEKSEEKPPQKNISLQNEEQSKKGIVRQEEEKPKIKSFSYQGEVPPKTTPTVIANSDSPGNGQEIIETEKITRQDIIEKNRVITVVRVIKGSKVEEYSRVNYSWGGIYFFKDNTTSIPENLFVQWTGVNN